jgi:hypothetical protein
VKTARHGVKPLLPFQTLCLARKMQLRRSGIVNGTRQRQSDRIGQHFLALIARMRITHGQQPERRRNQPHNPGERSRQDVHVD